MKAEDLKFRDLHANEIEIRQGRGGCLLLYKTARVDANILDETVGVCGWQKLYDVKDGKMYCRIGINIDGEWLWKEDCGEETQVEAAKGEASDAMKRAGFAWGIGRKLYTAPFIKDPTPADKNAKYYVREITFTDKGINTLVIVDKGGQVIFTWPKNAHKIEQQKPAAQPAPAAPVRKPGEPVKIKDAQTAVELNEIRVRLENYHQLGKLTEEQYASYTLEMMQKGKELQCTLTDGEGWVDNADLFGE